MLKRRLMPNLVLLGIVAAGMAWGQPAGTARKSVLPDFDARDAAALAEFAGARQAQATALVARRRAGMESFLAAEAANAGARITPNRFGVPKVLLREGRALSAPSTAPAEEIAKGFLRSHAALFPFAASEVENLRLLLQDAARDATFLAFNQTVDGIDVFHGQIKFTLSKAGEVVAVATGEVTPGLSLSTTPGLSVEEAVRAAFGAAGEAAPPALTPSPDAQGGARFVNPKGNRLNPITAELSVFPLTASSARLAYRIFLDLDAERYYEILVDAADGSLLFRHSLYEHGAQGTVWTGSPLTGSRQLVPFPPSSDPMTSPDPWLPTSANGAGGTGWVTTGNNTDAYLDANADDKPDSVNTSCMQSGRAYSATEDFTFPFGDGTVGLDPRNYQCAAVANLFYLVNLAHDFYYSVGFTETAKSFQTNNFGRGGVGNDAVLAEAQNVTNNSDFSPTMEGTPPHLRMGLWTHGSSSLTDDRDTDYNGQTALHEYGHGVSNRLVSAGASASCLAKMQSGAMGEGWSDYFAISYFNNPVYGAYESWNTTTGIRRQSYAGYTFTYADIGNGAYGYEVHDDGEIWAATLWDLRKSLGQTVTDRLVINGLKSTPCSPSMTDARDAILAADQAAGGGNRAAIWQVFARHGMGYSARGVDGTPRTGMLYDAGYDLPSDLQSSGNPAITSNPLSIATALGQSYMYQTTASNPNGGVLNYSLTSGPAGMAVNSASGAVTWNPAAFVGQRVGITVTDGKGGRVVHGYALPVITPLGAGTPVSIGGPIYSSGYATIAVPAGTPVLQVMLRNGSGDADLDVTDPNGGSWYSERDGTSTETLSFASPKAGTWQIVAYGYSTYSGVSLTANLITPTALGVNASLSGLSSMAGGEAFYRVTVPTGTSAFQISTSGGTGNVDLYARAVQPGVCQANAAVLESCLYDAKSTQSGNAETISLTNPASGDWYLDLSATAAYSGVTLTTGTGAATGPPVIASYTWAGTPTAGQPFSGTITGTNFASGMTVWFCPSSGGCQELPDAQAALNGATSVTVNNVSLAAGSWQIYLVNPGVLISAPSTAFVVLPGGAVGPPVIASYTWTTSPTENQPFGGTITGANFVSGLAVWFCDSAGNCQQWPAAQVTVNSATSVTVNNVSLAAGTWRIYLVTPAVVISAPSAAFVVQKAGAAGGAIITTVAGIGSAGFSGDGGQATKAGLFYPFGVAVDGSGGFYIADFQNNRIRKVSPSGMITTLAGNGVAGYAGDGSPATTAALNQPYGVAVDGSGNLYIADDYNHRVRKVSASGIITTVAGNGTPGYSGDGGPATSAQMDLPHCLALDGAGNLYITDQGNNRVRKVSTSGVITTVAGTGTAGYAGDGGPATSAQLDTPNGMAVDGAGNLYIGDGGNNRIRKVSTSGVITTVAGTGTAGYAGDGGPATSAQLNHPTGVAVDGAGNVYIADSNNHTVRMVSAGGIIATVAGNGAVGNSGDGGPATSALLNVPTGVAVASNGNIYIADYLAHVVRLVQSATPGGPPAITGYTWTTTPTDNQPFSGTITGTNFAAGIAVWFGSSSGAYVQLPAAQATLSGSTTLSVTGVTLSAGSWQIYLVTSSGVISAPSAAFTVGTAPPPPTTLAITGYTWTTTPLPNQPFSGTITGTGFVSGIAVWFCATPGGCQQLPPALVTLNNSTTLSVTNVSLSAGSWQVYVQQASGAIAGPSAAFVIQPQALPTITGYAWNPTPAPNQAFGGTITGTNFASGMAVWFCPSSGSCVQPGGMQATVTNSTSASVSGVSLAAGTWHFYVQTSAGPSASSTTFVVQPPQTPTVTGYTWNAAPQPNQPFSGTITGTGFAAGLSVSFCSSSGGCLQPAGLQVTANSSTSASLSNITLAAGSWQFYVQTVGGPSGRSTAFLVQAPVQPTIMTYSWSTAPTPNQPFSGTITGTSFVSGIAVWFCPGSGGCQQLPAAQVTLNSPSSVSVYNVTLPFGMWQVYVQTVGGSSPLSAAFAVAGTPTVASYAWSASPRANQPFGGTIAGTGFLAGMAVWFCPSSGSCTQPAGMQVTVTSSTSASVAGISLPAAGSWQFYVQTGGGISGRSTAFSVQFPTDWAVVQVSFMPNPITRSSSVTECSGGPGYAFTLVVSETNGVGFTPSALTYGGSGFLPSYFTQRIGAFGNHQFPLVYCRSFGGTATFTVTATDDNGHAVTGSGVLTMN